MNIKPQLFGKTLNELREIVSQLELPVYTAVQIADWIYQKEVVSFSEITNISLNNRKKSSKQISIWD